MKHLFFTLLAIHWIAYEIKAQNTLIIGEKSYSCTASWTFKNNSSDGMNTEDPTISIAKDGSAGILYVEVKVMDQSYQIISPCILYLADNTVIKCVTVLGRDKVDGNASATFKLTKEEIQKISVSRISTVRYTLQIPSGIPKWENPKDAHTASNKKYWRGMIGQTKPTDWLDYYETDKEVKTLFGL